MVTLVYDTDNVGLKLAEEDARAIERGELTPVHVDVTPSSFVQQGIELEDLQ